MIPSSGAYSLAPERRGAAVAVERFGAPSERDRRTPVEPATQRRLAAIAELKQHPLAALTLASDRRLLSANPTGHRLLELDLGFDLDAGRVRCTDSRHAARFAKAVHDAARPRAGAKLVAEVIEFGEKGSGGTLDVVVASPREPAPGGVALMVVRCRG